MKIHQIYTDSNLRNFTYVIELKNRNAVVIDPWSDELVNKCLNQYNLSLTTIINTHEHWDHTQGNLALVEQYGCQVWAHANGAGKIPGLSRVLMTDELIPLDDNTVIRVMNTPGHSEAHLCFLVIKDNKPTHVFTGDILFNAGVGNCHNGGNVDDLYDTISQQFHNLTDDIIILPGHEYLANNLQFTLDREPSNSVAKKWLEKYENSDIHTQPLTTTIADERNINTFFRLRNAEIIQRLPGGDKDEKAVFTALRALRDRW